MKWLVGWRMHKCINPVLEGHAKSLSNWQRVCVSAEKWFVETIKQKVCECLDHMGAYHHGPVSDFVLKEMGDYWEIYPREWQGLVHLQSPGCYTSAEHKTGILVLTRLCASTQGNGKDPTVIGRKKMPPDSEQVTSPSWTSAPPLTTKNLGPTLSKYLLNHWR